MSGTGITMHPSVKTLESVVKRVRDVLRKGDGITDMDSMAHCVLFTAARMLDTATAAKLNVQYTWDSVYTKVVAKDINGADKAFKDILEVLDSKFSTNEFTWKLKVQDDFEKIVKLFHEIDDIHEVAKHTDVLGFIYEQHLSTGAGAGRDLGKFYTDRQITRYLTELLGSDITAGRPDSMCDATMGTGGFILSYIDMVTTMCPEVKWDDYDLAGGDIDDKVAAIARLNVFLRTGKLFPMIRKRNTLKNDIGDSADKRKTFKRLLMNIPFGVKGLTLADDCCERVKELVKVGTKSEPLFMALTCQLLAEGGKAAVIIPDGVLVNCSKQHDTLRKYLLDNFKVLRIIKMRGKFFMNTGIQPSVIVFERSGKTDAVEFWDVEKVASGQLVETCMLKVSREKFDASCSFDMRRYQVSNVVANPAGFPMVKLGDYLEDLKTGKNKNDLVEGDYPFYMSNGISQYANTYQFDGEYVLTGRCGSLNGSQYYVNGKFSASDFTYVLKVREGLSAKYLYHYMRSIDWTKWQTGTTMKGIRREIITNYDMALPPLPIQEEIVEALDIIYNNAATAKTAVVSIKSQMAAVMRSVGARCAAHEKTKLGDYIEIIGGKRRTIQEATDDGEYDFITCSIMGISRINIADFTKEAIIINAINGSGRCRPYYSNKYSTTTNNIHFTLKSDCKIVSLKYLYRCLELNNKLLEDGFSGGNQKKIGQDYIKTIDISVPPIAVQTETLAILNEMEAELKTLEQMAAKAESRAKFILDGYLASPSQVQAEPVAEPIADVAEITDTNTIVEVKKPAERKTYKLKKTVPTV